MTERIDAALIIIIYCSTVLLFFILLGGYLTKLINKELARRNTQLKLLKVATQEKRAS